MPNNKTQKDLSISETINEEKINASLLAAEAETEMETNSAAPCRFNCESCSYRTNKSSSFNYHLSSKKHKIKNENINEIFTCENCCKEYKNKSGLWKHMKNCNKQINANVPFDKDKIILQLIKENSNLQTILQEQHIETMKIMSTMNTTNNIQNNVNSNNTFNLQVFLNETCKDAMNMSEFIDSIELNLSDVEQVGKNGFINGISDIVIRYLTKLDVHKRPVHCSDKKRETLYIKENNVWQEENLDLEDNIMLQLIRDVRDKNADNVHKWRDMYPQCLKAYSDKTDQYNMIVHEALGGDIKLSKKEKESKIISKIAKAVYIDKNKHRIPNV
jgi:hypothetical protein